MLSDFPSTLPHKAPFLPFCLCAGMKQPHLEIPSLLKAGSSRQLILSGKTLHHSATGWLGKAPGMRGLEEQKGCKALSPPASLWDPEFSWLPQ